MKLLYLMRMEDIAFVSVCLLVMFISVAIIRVGLYGEHLGRFKFVSFEQKYAERPTRRHRCVTAGMGLTFFLVGVAMLVFEFILLHMKAAESYAK